jgi:YD repeat-containing protein
MSKRSLSLILLSILVLASVPPTRTSKASASDGLQSADAQAKAKMERAIREAGESATYDQAGRVTKLTISVSDNEKVSFNLIYDERGRLQSLVQQDGTKMRLQYDAAGQWQGLVFDDGGRVTLERDREGKVTGTHTERPTRRKPSQLKGANPNTRRVAFTEDACEEATNKAIEAGIIATAACLADTASVACVTALATAALRLYQMHQACKANTIAAEESAV